MEDEFEVELKDLINKHSKEVEGGNTQDVVLARYLTDCLRTFGRAVEYSKDLKELNMSDREA